MPIKFDKYLLWLKPFTEAIADLVPIERLKEVKLGLYRSDKPPSYHGLCERLGNNKSYRIIVRTYTKNDRRWPMSPIDEEQLLINYAHEASHLKIFVDSDIDRFVLETKIYERFGQVLKQRGYEQKLNQQS